MEQKRVYSIGSGLDVLHTHVTRQELVNGCNGGGGSSISYNHL